MRIRRLSSTVAAELDATARWARRATAEDRRRLEPPPFPSAAPSTAGLDAYLGSRGWSLPGDDADDRACARRVVSHTLSYPMTLAAHAPRLLSLARARAAGAAGDSAGAAGAGRGADEIRAPRRRSVSAAFGASPRRAKRRSVSADRRTSPPRAKGRAARDSSAAFSCSSSHMVVRSS